VPYHSIKVGLIIARNPLRGKSGKMTKSSYSTGEAARLSGVPHRTVDYWAKTGLVAPSVANTAGSGISRLYSFKDLVALRVVKALREAGVSTQGIRTATRYISKVKNPLSECRLLAIGSSVAWVESSDQVTDVFRHAGQRVFPFDIKVVDYPELVREVAAMLAA